MCRKDLDRSYKIGYIFGYKKSNEEWEKKIYSIKSEIENYEDFDSMDRQVVKVVFSIMDKYMEDSNED